MSWYIFYFYSIARKSSILQFDEMRKWIELLSASNNSKIFEEKLTNELNCLLHKANTVRVNKQTHTRAHRDEMRREQQVQRSAVVYRKRWRICNDETAVNTHHLCVLPFIEFIEKRVNLMRNRITVTGHFDKKSNHSQNWLRNRITIWWEIESQSKLIEWQSCDGGYKTWSNEQVIIFSVCSIDTTEVLNKFEPIMLAFDLISIDDWIQFISNTCGRFTRTRTAQPDHISSSETFVEDERSQTRGNRMIQTHALIHRPKRLLALQSRLEPEFYLSNLHKDGRR